MGNSSFTESEISKFKEVSYKLGKNPSLVQAAGGNTSIKSDESMLIKASGTWLINSLNKDIFVGFSDGILKVTNYEIEKKNFVLPQKKNLKCI